MSIYRMLKCAIVYLLTTTSTSVLAETVNLCSLAQKPDDIISACTALIQSAEVSYTELAAALNNRGAAWLDNGEHTKAIQDLSEAIRLDPEVSAAYYNRGNVALGMRDTVRAIHDFDIAIRQNPTYVQAFVNRGIARSIQGEYDQAIADFSEAVRLDPDHEVALSNRGNAWFLKGDHDRALSDFDEAIKINPDYAMAYANRCWVGGQRGRDSKTLNACNEAMELLPDNPTILIARARISYRMADYFGALEDSTHAILLADAPTWGMYVVRAAIRFRLGRRDAANSDFRHAQALANDDDEVRKRVSELGLVSREIGGGCLKGEVVADCKSSPPQ